MQDSLWFFCFFTTHLCSACTQLLMSTDVKIGLTHCQCLRHHTRLHGWVVHRLEHLELRGLEEHHIGQKFRGPQNFEGLKSHNSGWGDKCCKIGLIRAEALFLSTAENYSLTLSIIKCRSTHYSTHLSNMSSMSPSIAHDDCSHSGLTRLYTESVCSC